MKQKLAEFLSTLSGMRKTIVMLFLLLIAVIFRELNLIDGGQMVDLLKNTVIAFFSSNAIEHIGETIKDFVKAKTAPALESDDAEPKLEG